MSVEAPKPAPKGALRRLGQRLEQILIPPIKQEPISDESRKETLESRERIRLRHERHPDQDYEFNSILDFITIPIKEMINFSYAKADEDRAEEARIKEEARINVEKKFQTTPVPPPLLPGEPGPSLGKLIQTFNEIKENLHHR